MVLGLKGIEVDVGKGDPATGDELLLETAFATDLVLVIDQCVHKTVYSFGSQFGPAGILTDSALGQEFHDFHTVLEKSGDIRFSFTTSQAADFNERFSSWQTKYSDRCGDEFVASVRRLGLITFRLAMILSALRIMEDGIIEDRLICLDTDYQSAMTMASVILYHNAHVFLTLPKADTAQTTSSATTTRTTLQQRQFLESLPPEFDRQTYTETALSINPRTADRIIRRWCDTGQLENVSHGKYRKK